jgi:hypothetical protein
MTNPADLWKEYCGFYEKPFSVQLEANEALLKEHLGRWGQTAQAKALCPNGYASIEDIPVTTYDDYEFLGQFRSGIEKLEKEVPRMPGELCWDYYDRIGRAASEPYRDCIVGEFAFATKTSGTVSEPKWAVHGSLFWENFRRDVIATTLFACSDRWGQTKFRVGDKGFNFTPSAPFLSGWGRKASQGVAEDVPPVEIMDNIPDSRRRFFVALEYLEKGHSVNLVGGIAPSVYLMCEYFSKPESLFEEYYHSMNVSPAKLHLLQRWIQAKLSKRSKDLTEFFQLKGLMIGGVDTELYHDYLKAKLGIDPLCIYGATELGLPMFGSPDSKMNLLPNLRSCYLEFRDENGELKKMSEIRQTKVYDVVATSFGGIFVRYDIGDMIRVDDIRDDGMPVLSFWGRKNDIVAIRGFLPRITEALAVQTMAMAGLSLSDKWAFTKSVDGNEKILILMENTWGLAEGEAERRIFNALFTVSGDFKHLVSENKIQDPGEILEVEYLRMGAFLRYSMNRGKDGYPMGQIKPPKIIPSERQDISDMLRRS